MSSYIDGYNEPRTADSTFEDEDGYESEVIDADVDDGQGRYLSPSAADDMYLNDGDSDDQDEASASEAQSRTWKVDPSIGQYHFKGRRRLKYAGGVLDAYTTKDLLLIP